MIGISCGQLYCMQPIQWLIMPNLCWKKTSKYCQALVSFFLLSLFKISSDSKGSAKVRWKIASFLIIYPIVIYHLFRLFLANWNIKFSQFSSNIMHYWSDTYVPMWWVDLSFNSRLITLSILQSPKKSGLNCYLSTRCLMVSTNQADSRCF